ncbi:uncharacterized protein [Manis javanica]|uniref:uncharacterized protein isoform X4 n=1 Tax=Manis javanica TaxID=9974 RepID=UPI00187A0FF1|nr:uncharacterized protein LOC108388420 isoform X6 [Manis javanica]
MREAAATGRDAAGLSTRCPAPRPPASRPGPRRGRCGREVRQRSLGRSGLRPEGRSAGRAQTRGPRPPPLAAGLHPALPARSGPVPPLGRFRFRFPGTVVKENESGRGQALRGCRRGEGRRVRGGRPGAGSREPGPQPPPVEECLVLGHLQALPGSPVCFQSLVGPCGLLQRHWRITPGASLSPLSTHPDGSTPRASPHRMQSQGWKAKKQGNGFHGARVCSLYTSKLLDPASAACLEPVTLWPKEQNRPPL